MARYIDPRTPSVLHGPAVHLHAEDFDDEPTVAERILAAALDPTGLLAVLAVVLWAILI